jgi:hypothetical protein
MTRFFVAAALLGCVVGASAEGPAVHSTNFLVGFATGDTYVGDRRTSNQYNLHGEATLPLGTAFGASLAVGYGDTNLATNPFPDSDSAGAWPECAVRDERVAAGLFARDPGIGRVGLDVAHGTLQSRCNATFLSTGDNILRTDHSKISAEYYFQSVTLAADRGKVRLEGGAELDSASVTAGWYPTRNSRLTLSADGLDYQNTYKLGFEFQPVIIDHSLSLFVTYITQRQDIDTHTLMLGFNYFYEPHVNLIARDRRYR